MVVPTITTKVPGDGSSRSSFEETERTVAAHRDRITLDAELEAELLALQERRRKHQRRAEKKKNGAMLRSGRAAVSSRKGADRRDEARSPIGTLSEEVGDHAHGGILASSDTNVQASSSSWFPITVPRRDSAQDATIAPRSPSPPPIGTEPGPQNDDPASKGAAAAPRSSVGIRRNAGMHLPRINVHDFGHGLHFRSKQADPQTPLQSSALPPTSALRSTGRTPTGRTPRSAALSGKSPMSITRTISFREPDESLASSSSRWFPGSGFSAAALDEDSVQQAYTDGCAVHRYSSRGGASMRSAWSADESTAWSETGTDDGSSTIGVESTGRFHFRIGLLDKLRERRRRLHEEDEKQVIERRELSIARDSDAPEAEDLKLYRKTPIVSGIIAPFSIMLE